MNVNKGLVATIGIAVLMMIGVACGSNELDTGDRPMEILQALEAAEGSVVTVSGFLVADKDGSTRLCSVLLESGPPQCGGDRIDLLGFDASSVPNSETPQRPSEIGTSRWTSSHITVTGIKGIGGLAEVRLSSPVVSHGGPVTDYVSLVDNLRAAGATVDPAGTVSSDFFGQQGQVLTVNGEDIQAFEFASAEEADTVAKGVSASGSSISRVDSETGMGVAISALWVAPPHFYKAGKLIVLYVGSDSDVINALQEAMGSQFAGG